MPLEHAVAFLPLTKPDDLYWHGGFYVLVDPGDEEDLVRWEQVQRSLAPKRRSWL